MKTSPYLMILLFAMPLMAQEAPADTAQHVPTWKNSLVGALTATQVAYTDWVQGGDNSFAWTLLGDGKTTYETGKTKWISTAKLAYGRTKLGNRADRKTDDRLELESVYNFQLGCLIKPYVAATLKSQFTHGYTYNVKDRPTAVSDLFDPAYLTQSMGLGYNPIKEVKIRLGAAVRETFTRHFNVYSDDPKTKAIEKSLVLPGGEAVTNVDWKLAANIMFSSSIEIFSDFKTFNRVVVRSNNTLSAKVSKLVTVIANCQTIDEPRMSKRTQLKQSLSLGLSYSFL